MYIDLFAEIETFSSIDPMGKVLHGIRPSEYQKYKRNIEDSFLKHKSHVTSTLNDIVAKLSTWNTYFGLTWEGIPEEIEVEAEAEVEVEPIVEIENSEEKKKKTDKKKEKNKKKVKK